MTTRLNRINEYITNNTLYNILFSFKRMIQNLNLNKFHDKSLTKIFNCNFLITAFMIYHIHYSFKEPLI